MIRPIRPGEAEKYVGHVIVSRWCRAIVFGYALDKGDGNIDGIGLVTIGEDDRCWLWLDLRQMLPAIVLHRRARQVIEALRSAGVKRLQCFCETGGAERWLKRLGFRPHHFEVHPTGQNRDVWVCDL